MAGPAKVNLQIVQGGTFRQILRWESSTKNYASITGVPTLAPLSLTAVAHGIPVGWRSKITNVGGMKELNSTEFYQTITASTADTVNINAINAIGYQSYTTGGVLEYNMPVDLTGLSGIMQIREKVGSPVILELTSANGGVVVSNTNKTVTIIITAVDTELLNFSFATYNFDLFNSTEVTPFTYGLVTLVK